MFNTSRLDLTYDVHKMSQFMHPSISVHEQSVKHILHYVKGTISFGT